MLKVLNILSSKSGGSFEVANLIDKELEGDRRFINELRINSNFLGRLISSIERKSLMNSYSKKNNLFIHLNYGYFEPVNSLSKFDIVNVHWTPNSTFGLKSVERLSNTTKVVISLHDFHFITGGCHTPVGCENFRDICDNCPLVDGYVKKEIVKKRKESIDALSENKNIFFVSPSSFVYNSFNAKNSFLIFNPIEKSLKRKKVKDIDVLFFSDKKNWFIKGYDRLRDYIDFYKSKNLKIVVVGDEIPDLKGIDFYPFLKKEKLLDLFDKSKYFFLSSRFETFSLMAHEALDRGCDIIFDDLEIGWELSLSFPKRVNQYKNLKLRENKLIKKIDFESYKDFYLWLQKN